MTLEPSKRQTDLIVGKNRGIGGIRPHDISNMKRERSALTVKHLQTSKKSTKTEVDKVEQVFSVNSGCELEISRKENDRSDGYRATSNLGAVYNTPSIDEQQELPKVVLGQPQARHVDDKTVNENCPLSLTVKEVNIQFARSFGESINDERQTAHAINTKIVM